MKTKVQIAGLLPAVCLTSQPNDRMAQTALPGFEGVPFDLENVREFFPTPYGIALYAVDRLVPDLAGGRPAVLDAGAGGAIWSQAAKERWPHCLTTGIDLPGVPSVPQWCDRWVGADFLEWGKSAPDRFDVILSNPPFSKAEEFIRLSMDLIKPGGYVVFLLRQAFRAGINRGRGLWSEHPPMLISTSSRRPSFTGNGVSDSKTEYSVYVWWKGYSGPTIDPGVFDYDDPGTWADREQVREWVGHTTVATQHDAGEVERPLITELPLFAALEPVTAE